MPPRGKESIIRRQKELARQQKQKEKQARRAERRTQQGGAEEGTGDLISVEELVGSLPEELVGSLPDDAADKPAGEGS